jgi:hypothetical protein
MGVQNYRLGKEPQEPFVQEVQSVTQSVRTPWRREKNLSLPGTEPKFLGYPARST